MWRGILSGCLIQDITGCYRVHDVELLKGFSMMRRVVHGNA